MSFEIAAAAVKAVAAEVAGEAAKGAAKEVAGKALEKAGQALTRSLPELIGEGGITDKLPDIIGEPIGKPIKDVPLPKGGFIDGGINNLDRILKNAGIIPAGEAGMPEAYEHRPGLRELNALIKNKLDGLERERAVYSELQAKYPENKGFEIIPEAYLRDKDGNIVRDPVTGEARRIDFVVAKDGKAVDSIEVTSNTADKTQQAAKESRIREIGGSFIKDSDGNLIEIPSNVQTRIERRA